MVGEHAIEKTLHEEGVDPDHASRTESETFRKAKERLREDGHYQCWVCGSTDRLQAHHYGCEWHYEKIVDYDKLKQFLLDFDVYGYSHLLKHKPLTTVDDIRNQMYLCREHHEGVNHANNKTGTGIHDMEFPEWLIQKLAMDGAIPIPQKGETIKEVLDRVKLHERK